VNAIALSGALSNLVAQMGPNVDVGVDPGTGLVGGAVGAFLTTLVVGGILVAVAPEYTERMGARVLDEPVGAFVYGVVALLTLVVVTVLLAITIIGILVAVPLAIVAYVVWAVGAAIAYLAIGDRLVGHDDGWLKPLLVGAGINGVLALTGIGGLIAFCIGATGFGAVLRNWLD
jgi:hypothetical protein